MQVFCAEIQNNFGSDVDRSFRWIALEVSNASVSLQKSPIATTQSEWQSEEYLILKECLSKCV